MARSGTALAIQLTGFYQTLQLARSFSRRCTSALDMCIPGTPLELFDAPRDTYELRTSGRIHHRSPKLEPKTHQNLVRQGAGREQRNRFGRDPEDRGGLGFHYVTVP